MKSKFLSLSVAVIFIMFSAGIYAQKGIVNNGAKISVSTGGIIKISGTDGHYTNKTSGSTHGRIDLDGKLKLSGNWNNLATSGNVLINVDTDGEVILEGTTAQSIQGNQTNFEKLTLNNASGATLATNSSVNGNFTFTSGRMTLGSYNLTLGTATSIVGTPSSTAMFLANGTGELRKLYSTPGSFTFPVGENTGTIEYSPITLNFTSGTFGASAYAGVRVIDAKHPNNSASTDYITRYWRVVQNNISSFSCGVTGTYLTADIVGTEANMFTGKWNSPNWLKLDAVNTSLDQISGTFTLVGDFSAGGQAMFCSPAIALGTNVTDVTCYGGNNGAIDLSVTNGLSPYTYNWTTVGGSGLINGIQDQSGLTEGTYYVTVTDVNSCSATESISVIYLHDPVANAGSDGGLCPGQTTYQLNGSGGSSYEWSPTTGLSDPNINNPIANPASTTTYTLTVTDAYGCKDTDQATVTVNTIPTAGAGADDEICFGQSTTITASGGGTYEWDNGLGSGVTHIVSPASTTTYTVTVTNASNCTDTDDVLITVFSLPVANAGTDDDLCPGQSTVQLSASGGTGYVWSPTTGLSNPNIFNPVANPATTTTYTVTVYDSNGCSNTDNVLVTVNSIPVANADTDDDLCPGQSTVQLSASGGTGYVWSPTTGLSDPNIFNPVANPATTTTYTVTVSNVAGCTSTDNVQVIVNTIPTASITGTTTICAGNSTTLTASGGDTYYWSTGSTNISIIISPATTTTYTVTATNTAGCYDTESSIVTVNPLPVVDAGIDQSIPNGTSTALDATVTGSGPFTYLWSPIGSLVDPNIEDPTTQILSTTTAFTLLVTDNITGCQASDMITVTVSGGPLSVVADATPDAVCLGFSSQLEAITNGGSGLYDYEWESSPAGFSSFSQNPIVNPTVTTTYYVTVDDGFTTSTSSVLVTVYSLPLADAGSDADVCLGKSTILTATGGDDYEWSNGALTASTTVSPSVNTTYTVTVTDANGCTDTDDVLVTVNSLPVANAGSDDDLCPGQSTIQLSASGGTGYVWSPTTGLSDPNIFNPVANPGTTTTYTVTVTDINGCSNTDNVLVTVNTLPVAYAGTDQAICSLNSATLTATGGSSYYWSTTETTTSITVSPLSSTIYSVTVTDANLCTSSDDVEVTVYTLPTADAGSDASVCIGESTTISATGGDSYIWNNGLGAGQSHLVSPTVTTNYTVTATDVNGCSDTDDVLITVNPLPVANAGLDQTICLGESATLTATGGGTYEWDNGLGSGVTHIVSPVVTTTYTVTVTSGAGCEASDNVQVTVNSLPTANAGTDKVICLGNSTTINATGGVSYEWDNGLGAGASHSVSPVVTTTYTVTVTGSNSCTNTDQVDVFVNPLPNAFAGADETICYGESVTLSATGGDNYSWDNGVDQDVPFTPSATVTYSVTVTDSNGCSDTDDVIVTVNPLPIADAGSNQTICFGETATLTATGGIDYEWSTLEVTQSIDVNPATTTIYYVTVTDNNTCSAVDDVTVNVNPLPVPDAGSDQTICQGDEVILIATGGLTYAWDNGVTQGVPFYPMNTLTYTVTASDANFCTNTDEIVVTVLTTPTAYAGVDQTICEGDEAILTATGGVSYSWSGGVIQSTVFYPTTTNTYTVTVTGANGCKDTDDVTVNVNAAPPAFAGVDVGICDGSSAILTASGGISYYWSTTETTTSITVTPASSTTYYVTVTDGNMCTASDNVVVSVNPNPVAFAGDDQSICFGDNITLTATGGSSYTWSGGISQGLPFIPVATETYFVTVTNSFSCTATDDLTITVNDLPIAYAGADQAVCDGESVTLTATGGISYIWNGGISQGIPFIPSASGDYIVTATDNNGCSQADTVSVTVNELPVVFAGFDQSIPYGTFTVMDATVSGGSGTYSFSWTPADSLVNATIEDAVTNNLYNSNIFTLVVTDDVTGCSGSDEVTIIVTGGPLLVNPYASNDTICEGESTQLYAFPSGGSGSYSYSWISNPPGFTSNDENPIVTPNVTTIYSVTLDDGSTNVTESVTIVVNPLPIADAGINDTICQGETVVLSATGGTSYTWDNSVIQDVGFVPTFSNTYYVTVSDVNGCTNTDNIYIEVNALPVADAGFDQQICEGDSVVLSANGGDTYLWDNGVVQDVYFIPTATLTYTVVVTDINGCSATDQLDVTVNLVPLADAGSDLEICEGTSVVLSATGGNTYDWSDGVVQDVPFIPSATNTYIVTVSNSFGCSTVDSVTITVNSAPIADAGSDQTVCFGESVTLTATGGILYDWSGSITQSISFIPTATEIFYVTVTSAEGCTSVDNVTVTVNELPVVDAGIDQIISYQTSTTLNATVTGGSGSYTYLWTPADSLVNATIVDPTTIDLDGTTLFTLLVTDDITGCTNSDDIMITILGGPLQANPVADPDTICEGETIQLYTMASGGSGSFTYSWASIPVGFTSSDADPTDQPIVSTNYIVTLDDGNEIITDSVFVVVYPIPFIDLGPDTILCPDDTLTLDAGIFDSYLWSTGETTQTIEIDSADVGIGTLTYFVTVFENGCENTDYVDVTYDVCSEINDISISELSVNLYPNPSAGKVYASFNGFSGSLTLSVMDMNGKLVYKENLKKKPNSFIHEIDLSKYAEGVYIVKFTNDSFNKIESIVLYK
ncbi:MAG: T9SS type A sorting domain-containing protein [Bacteroidota bacterium]